MDYRFIEDGSAPGAWTEAVEASGEIYTYPGEGSILQVSYWPEITLPDTMSAQIEVKLYRDDAVIDGDVLAKSFDFHVEVDSFGSKEELIK